MQPRALTIRQKFPNVSEGAAVGAFKAAILRNSSEFKRLIRNGNPDIVFKGEERNRDDDRMMTPRLSEKCDALAELVQKEFPGLKLRITEAWDDSRTHAAT